MTVTIQPINDAPVAHDDGLWVAVDTVRIAEAPGVMADDIDVDGDPLTAQLVDLPSHRSVMLAPDGGLSYSADGRVHPQDAAGG